MSKDDPKIEEYDLTNPTRKVTIQHPVFKSPKFQRMQDLWGKSFSALIFTKLRINIQYELVSSNDLFVNWLDQLEEKQIFFELNNCLIRLNQNFINFYMHHALGGAKDKTYDTKPGPISKLEIESLKEFISSYLTDFNKSWTDFTKIKFELKNFEADKKFLSHGNDNQEFLISSYQFENHKGVIDILFLSKKITPLFKS